jgi:penicillin amidase
MSVLNAVLGAIMRPALRAISRSRLPAKRGVQSIPALEGRVEVFRDQWGIPHIYADHLRDAFRAQGYVHAQDRLWQMEVNRRVGRGRLAKLFGEVALDTDRLIRTFGFHRLGQADLDNLPADARAEVEAYAEGVNAFIEQAGKRLPVEFMLVGHRPEPWTPLDSMAFARVMIWQLSHAWASAIVRARIIKKVGPERAADLEIKYPERHPITLPEGIEFNRLEPDGMLKAAQGPYLNKGLEAGFGSNGWVVAASKSASGHAVLCNDMHLKISAPGLWYFVHLNAGENSEALHVAGVSLPGTPYVMVGHNARIAWGMTLAFTDCEDVFVEQFDPEDPHRYHFKSKWLDAKVIPEAIRVKGQDAPHVEDVIITRHGPLISKALDSFAEGLPTEATQALAVQSMALRPCKAVQGFRALNHAQGWDTFVDAMRLIEAPQLNVVYADVEDNIGYWVTGKVPIRAQGQGLLPAPGWTGEYEWVGTVPFEEMPHALNPERGYIVTCNHRIVSDDYPYFLGAVWMNGYRARRIVEVFDARDKITAEDHANLHLDFTSLSGADFVQRLAGLTSQDADVRLALELLHQWDGVLSPDSSAGSVFKVTMYHLVRGVLEPTLGEDLTLDYMGRGPHPLLQPTTEFHGHAVVAIMAMLDNPRSKRSIYDDQPWWIEQAGGREKVLTNALKRAVEYLRQEFGPDTSAWAWGNLHKIVCAHSLSVQPPLDRVFDIGPFPIGGDGDTVCQTAYLPEAPYYNNAWSPSHRQIFDMGNLPGGLASVPPGQSGQVGSPHYDDLVRPWLEGKYFTVLWTREAVEAACGDKMILEPVELCKNVEGGISN